MRTSPSFGRLAPGGRAGPCRDVSWDTRCRRHTARRGRSRGPDPPGGTVLRTTGPAHAGHGRSGGYSPPFWT
ncbi:hypothetical protein ACFPM0_07435 [Pseudonocardia sulfidoxydans]|uniref:hypothetical protein n=1 Tax=Pseudonocardia sulfidoxydans TaxID=54011 RepID=UPI00361CA790